MMRISSPGRTTHSGSRNSYAMLIESTPGERKCWNLLMAVALTRSYCRMYVRRRTDAIAQEAYPHFRWMPVTAYLFIVSKYVENISTSDRQAKDHVEEAKGKVERAAGRVGCEQGTNCPIFGMDHIASGESNV